MKPEKAIELLSDLIFNEHSASHTDDDDAIKLGIEALEAVIDARANNYWTPIPTLPGETED